MILFSVRLFNFDLMFNFNLEFNFKFQDKGLAIKRHRKGGIGARNVVRTHKITFQSIFNPINYHI